MCLENRLLIGPGGPFENIPLNDSSAIRGHNRKAIDRLLYENKGLTKNEIAQRLSLSMPTVTSILQEMEKDGILECYQEKEAATGRPPLKYLLNRKAHACTAVLIREDSFKMLICDVHGRSLFTETFFLAYENSGKYWQEVCALISESMDKCEVELKKSIGVNIILPCQVNPMDQTVIDRRRGANFSSFNVYEMEETLEIPVYLNNFYESAAFELGSSVAPHGNCVYLHVSDFIHSVFIMGGRIFRPWESELGSAGHIVLVPLGKKCWCGKYGCAEAYCSTEVFKENFGECISDFFKDRMKNLRKQAFWYEYLSLLAVLISNHYNAFKMPVYIGGQLAGHLDEDDLEQLNTMVCSATGSPYCLYLAGDAEDLAIYGAIKILLHNFR
ncbi:MAG: ROK family transcriptional regulator [Oscillospiraceae bacterium]